MRAHMPVDKRIRREIDRISKEQVEKERHGFSRRVFKVMIYVLNTEFGFGVTRLKRAVDGMQELFESEEHNPVFWRQIDHHVIDFLGIPFERESTDLDGNLQEDQ